MPMEGGRKGGREEGKGRERERRGEGEGEEEEVEGGREREMGGTKIHYVNYMNI